MKKNGEMTMNAQMFAISQMITQLSFLGFAIDVDPDVADHMGAFEEAALDVNEAEESRLDVDPDTGVVLNDSMEGEA